tara:strand:- start:108 stop:2216 length:2109 start_codon:yes stop_codon:yes gene_type:complete
MVVSNDTLGPRSVDSVVTLDESPRVSDEGEDTNDIFSDADGDEGKIDQEEVSDDADIPVDTGDATDEIDEPDTEDVSVDTDDVGDTSDADDTGDAVNDTVDVSSDIEIDSSTDTADTQTDTEDVVEPECVIDDDCEKLDDDNLCNGTWNCVDSSCVFNDTFVDCSATSTLPCFTAVCSPSDGTCQPQKMDDGTSCDDSDPCTENDVCVSGLCTGDSITCPCLDDADCLELEDDSLCNGTLSCVDGDCSLDPTSVIVCDDSLTCTNVKCVPDTGACASSPVICNDDIGCTNDVCVEDVGCTFTADHPSCNDGDDCTVNTCNMSSGCTAIPSFAPCDDGEPCTENDTCNEDLECVGSNVECYDANSCTNDSCQNGDCLFTPNTNACDDGDPCTIEDACSGSTCAGEQVCECESNADCAAKNDLNLCNGSYMCDKSTAIWTCEIDPSTIVECTDPIGQCLVTSCVPSTGACVESQAPTNTLCDDGDSCTTNDACSLNGSCTGITKTCNDENQCTNDSCDSDLGCVYQTGPIKPCDDGDENTVTDQCTNGSCAGVVLFKEFFTQGAPDNWNFDQNTEGSIIFDVTDDEWNGDASNFYLGVWVVSETTITETLVLSVTTPELAIPNSENPKLSFVRWGTIACGVGNLHWYVDDVLVDGSCGSENDVGTFISLDPTKDSSVVTFTYTIQPGTYNPGLMYRIDNVKVNK